MHSFYGPWWDGDGGRERGGLDSLAVLALAAGRSRPHASASPSVEWERWLQHVWGMAVPS